MNFEEEYISLIEDSFFMHEHKVRFVITKVNSVLREISNYVILYEYNDYCKEVYKDVKIFTKSFKEKYSTTKISSDEQLLILFENLVKKQIDKKVGVNEFEKWFLKKKSCFYKTQIEYFKKEYF